MKYRSEIDGLRAIAVLPVILFHAGVSWVKGGFVGVDIFFVISGYLITSIILSDVAAGKFSIVDFYERRFRRILPALFFVIACTWIPASFWLMPSEMKAFSQSLVSVSLFASNILFWKTSGYFDTVTELKPLLHTWSLGVEEQFYLFFPLIILLLWKFGRSRLIVPTLIAISAVSLLAAEWFVSHSPMLSFYWLPFRAWELLAGSLSACYLRRYSQENHGAILNQIGSLAGLGLLLLGIFTFEKIMPFPGLSALVPVMGAVWIILFATPDTWVGKLLSWKPMVQIGLISYSAYLWHNPLFALARIRSEFPVESLPLMLGLAALSLVLAYLTWEYVEAPFRNKKMFNRRQIFTFSLTGSLMMFAIGLAGHFHYKSLEYKNDHQWHTRVRSHTCLLQEDDADKHDPSCFVSAQNGQKSVLLWGDSHAASLYQGFAPYAAKNHIALTQLTQSACPPIIGWHTSMRLNCAQINQNVMGSIQQNQYDAVILDSMWFFEKAPSATEDIVAGLERTIQEIRSVSPESQIIIVANLPRWYISVERAYVRANSNGSPDKIGPLYQRAVMLPELEQALRQAAGRHQAAFLAPSDYLCRREAGQSQEYAYCLLSENGLRGQMLYIDADHLSKSGAELLIGRMSRDLDRILGVK